MIKKEHQLDFNREERLGFGETIYCESKNYEQINAILDEASSRGVSFLLTRLSQGKFEALSVSNKEKINFDPASETGFFQFSKKVGKKDLVAVISAGTSDSKVAYEAIKTLEFNGVCATQIFDIGVSGLWRVLDCLEEINRHPIIIAVAGMDAAMPTVLGGLVSGVLIAVPTSVGYGASRDGETALTACLVSCAPGVTVCNIDNGYGAAIAALRVIQASGSIKDMGATS